MASAINRQPHEKTILVRLSTAYKGLEAAVRELEAINLTRIPLHSPIRTHVKAAREASRTALGHTGSAIKTPRTSVHHHHNQAS